VLGAIIGDIVGSRFEFKNHRSKEFELFTSKCRVTDDSIMTLAVSKAVMEARRTRDDEVSRMKGTKAGWTLNDPQDNCGSDPDSWGSEQNDAGSGSGGINEKYYITAERLAVKYMQRIGRKYPKCGYGGRFRRWIFSDTPQPYNSFGNGAAMRISPVGFAAESEEEVVRLSRAVTAVTHNHPEGIKGAEAVAMAIYMARKGCSKEDICDRITRNYYSLDFTIDEIRGTYKFDVTCQGSVPQAIEAFLESESFEDAIRTAVSVGGDSDTIAAIAGSIAEAFYGVPEELKDTALLYLDSELRAIFDEWYLFIGCQSA